MAKSSALPATLCAKEPYISAKERYFSTKELYISAKEPCISAREPFISAITQFSQQRCAQKSHTSRKTALYLCQTAPYVHQRYNA